MIYRIEGHLREQKLNDISLLDQQDFLRHSEHFLTYMSNRVEHQNKTFRQLIKWRFGFVLGVQPDLRQTPTLIITNPIHYR